jgi:hypothetical protein
VGWGVEWGRLSVDGVERGCGGAGEGEWECGVREWECVEKTRVSCTCFHLAHSRTASHSAPVARIGSAFCHPPLICENCTTSFPSKTQRRKSVNDAVDGTSAPTSSARNGCTSSSVGE